MENLEQKQEDNLVGILAYITLIGWIVALVLNNEKKGEAKAFGAYHLRQSLGLMIVGFVLAIALSILSAILVAILSFLGFFSFLIFPIFSIGMLVLAILGIINAANNKMVPLPFIGKLIEDKLKNTFE